MARFYAPIHKVDAEERMVWGYASTAAEDADGETITLEALREALPEFAKFGNIRQMHQLSAVGKATEAAVDDKGLYIAAKIVDDEAWRKVTSGVYQGFSVGGRATSRDPADRKRILGLTISEVSLVDRPSCPEAVFDCYKAAAGGNLRDDAEADQIQIIKTARVKPAASGDDAVMRFWRMKR
jgi:phage head maturation protease